jgi:CheY-like chemotaxis protein
VEDDALTTKLVRNLLERLHCEVEVAGNGREAVQKSSRRIYDAILLDYNLPLMNGMEVTRLIRANEARARLDPTPVIILTGDARLDKTEPWYHAGVTAHLVKPFEFDDLAATLEHTLKDAPSLHAPHAQAQPQG